MTPTFSLCLNTRAIWLPAAALLFVSTLASAQLQRFPSGEFPLTNYARSAVDLSELMTGGPPRDGIPAIDSPEFVSIESAAQWLQDREPVVAFVHEQQARAYPLQILMYHEIVNDKIGERPITVTFCPLCNASIVFDSTVGEGDEATALDFGTTGRLRKSDLVMYDRQTETFWQQFSGRGIIGDYTDTVLKQLPSQIVSFETFKTAFPNGSVLSKDTGFVRPYGNNPYHGYDDIDNNPFLFDGKVDSRLPAMERVLSVTTAINTHLLPLSALADKPLLNIDLDDQPAVIFAASKVSSALDKQSIADSKLIPAAAAFDPQLEDTLLSFELRDGAVVDRQTESHWNGFGLATQGELAGTQLQQLDSGVHFAFAWLAFNPDSKIVTVD